MSKLIDEQRQIEKLVAQSDQDIDTSDLPERDNWVGAEVGKFYRPVKKQVTLRLDTDMLEWFRGQGDRYQTRINQALREYMEDHRRAS